MKEEIMRVLKMVEEGKIDADKGAQLIEAINKQGVEIAEDNKVMAKKEIENDSSLAPHIKESVKESLNEQIDESKKSIVSLEKELKVSTTPIFVGEEKNEENNFKGERMLKIRVLSSDGDKVNITLPLKFVKGMIKACGKIPNVNVENMEGVNTEEMTDTVMAAIDSDITGKIVDIKSGDGDIVEIIIE